MFPIAFFSVLAFVGGLIFGIQMEIAWQFASIVVWVMIISWGPWEEMEILLPLIVAIAFYAGVIVGDISYFLQVDHSSLSLDWINNIGDLFKADP